MGRDWESKRELNAERVLTHGGAMRTYPPLEGVRDPWGSEHAELCEADRALPIHIPITHNSQLITPNSQLTTPNSQLTTSPPPFPRLEAFYLRLQGDAEAEEYARTHDLAERKEIGCFRPIAGDYYVCMLFPNVCPSYAKTLAACSLQ